MVKNFFDNIVTVQNLLDRRTLLEGLAEEAAELSQAALKLIRAEKMNSNVTPVDVEEAEKQLLEEIADVRCYLNALEVNYQGSVFMNILMTQKMKRWVERLESVGNEKES